MPAAYTARTAHTRMTTLVFHSIPFKRKGKLMFRALRKSELVDKCVGSKIWIIMKSEKEVPAQL